MRKALIAAVWYLSLLAPASAIIHLRSDGTNSNLPVFGKDNTKIGTFEGVLYDSERPYMPLGGFVKIRGLMGIGGSCVVIRSDKYYIWAAYFVTLEMTEEEVNKLDRMSC